jgi:hypothetical protein
LSVLYGYIRCNLGIWYGYDGLLLKKNIPVRYDRRQNQPALYQDQSGVTWGKTNQPYTRTSQVWHEAIPVLYQGQSGVTWGNTSLIPGPVRCDMRQYQSYTWTSQVWHEAIPVLYQDQSGVTWGNTNQPYYSTTSGYLWPSGTVKSPGFFKLGSCFSFF